MNRASVPKNAGDLQPAESTGTPRWWPAFCCGAQPAIFFQPSRAIAVRVSKFLATTSQFHHRASPRTGHSVGDIGAANRKREANDDPEEHAQCSSPPWKKLGQPVGQERGTIVFWRMRFAQPRRGNDSPCFSPWQQPRIPAPVRRALLALRAPREGARSVATGREKNNPTDLLKALNILIIKGVAV